MMANFVSSYEVSRLAALASYNILDTLPERNYDAITQIAAHICQVPISTITLIDDKRQWFKSNIGLDNWESPREFAFCNYAIQTPDRMTEVTNAPLDERFANNPLVTGAPHIVFYAGVPLVDGEGYALGTLCVVDRKTRQLTDEQGRTLKALADQVVSQLQLRRSQAQLEQSGQTLKVLNGRLSQTYEALRTVVNTSPAGLALWQPVRKQGAIVDFRFVFSNPVFAAQNGLSDSPREGQLLSLFPPVAAFEQLVSVVETKSPQQYQQRRDNTQNSVWNEVTLSPCGDGVLLTAQDITHLKKTEEHLRGYTADLTQRVEAYTSENYQLSALQQAILRHAGSAIVTTNLNGVIQTVNPAAEKLLNYCANELVGHKALVSLFEEQNLETLAQGAALQAGHPVAPDFSLLRLLADSQPRECTLLTREGTPLSVLMTRTALRNEAGLVTGYIDIATDMTPQKQMESFLQKSLQREQELNKLKSQFVTTASHEFRTPLTTIQSSVDLIERYLDRVPDPARAPIQRHLGIIEDRIQTFNDLLSDLLTMGRIEAGKVVYQPQCVDVVAFCEEIVETHFSAHLTHRRLEIIVEGAPAAVNLDKKLVSHALINLLSNAFKFSAKPPRLGIGFSPSTLCFTVTDQGIGIPAEDLPNLFQAFSRARNVSTIQGTGLGLVIARQFIEAHGGTIELQSQEGQGTTFTITLPITYVDPYLSH